MATPIERAQQIIRAAPRGPWKILGKVQGAPGVATGELVRVGYLEHDAEITVFLATSDAAARYLTGSADPGYGWAAALTGSLALAAEIDEASDAPLDAEFRERVVERTAQLIAEKLLR